MSEFYMPSLGADMDSAILMEWKVKPGDKVSKGDIVAEVETMKGILEVEIFQDGVIDSLLIEPESDVPVGTAIAIIKNENDISSGPEQKIETKEKTQEISEAIPVLEVEKKPIEMPKVSPLAHELEMVDARLKISPAARRRARELGVKIEGLSSGTGHGGAICIADIESIAAGTIKSPEEQTIQVSEPVVEETKLSTIKSTQKDRRLDEKKPDLMRMAIANTMSRSKREIPHFYLSHTIDMTPALQWMQEYNEEHAITERLVYAALLIKAVALALKKYKEFNGFWKNDEFIPSTDINVGMAISLRSGGLVAPAILNSDQKSLSELMTCFRDLVSRAKNKQLRASEMSNGTITITSLGDRGVEQVFPVIYPPQVAMIGFGTILKRPWVLSDGGLAPRDLISVSLAADHRVSDGHRGGLLLARIEKLLLKPEDLL